MENIDVIVLRRLRDWRLAGQSALLATVVRTWGSSPRPVGSIMGLAQSGAVVGSVSGGCIEDDLIYRFTQSRDLGSSGQASPMEGPPQTLRYGITAGEANRLGLPGGGTLELLLEFNPDAQSLSALVAQLESGTLMQRTTELKTGDVTIAPARQADGLQMTETALINTFGPEYRMLLILNF